MQDSAAAIAKSHGVRVVPVHGDLTDESTVERFAAEIREKLGPIDILVNCAGGDIGAKGVDVEFRNLEFEQGGFILPLLRKNKKGKNIYLLPGHLLANQTA